MKTNHFAIIMATLTLASCAGTPKANGSGDPNLPKYYDYNPRDTVGNELYVRLLSIDSARAEYEAMNPSGQQLQDITGVTEFINENLKDQEESFAISADKHYAQACNAWFALLKLCSQQQFEEAAQLYMEHEVDYYTALGTSTNKFDLDYFVGGVLLMDHLPKQEALEKWISILELDRYNTEQVIQFGESQHGYAPPHYPFLLTLLNNLYLAQGNREKAESLIEPYSKATYLLSDDSLQNEFEITDFKISIYNAFDDQIDAEKAFLNFRDFLSRHTKDTIQDMDEQIAE